ncbi:ring-infected erythrocyte surface antigen 2, putative [Plasmodium gaboni]|uniref:Ring-infected erythrocyte surface antigen 2, putative n=1 Tax=Plasmodium gaboni TaxID=647221 RepID=A0ABY0KWC0_9APIC|nr:ring-infected erythrocyte surface antigen 2, putative [Plasmodium gaboni]
MCFSKKYLCIRHIVVKNKSICFFQEVLKQNKSFLKILCSKRLVLPILGMIYIILNVNLTYNANSTSRLQITDRCSRNLYGKQLSKKPYTHSGYPVVISQVYGLPKEKPTFNLECTPDIDYTNILGFNEKLMNDANRYKINTNYEVIPHINEFQPLIVDDELSEYNQKVDNIGRNGEDILTAMQTLWNEIMDINKKKYNILKEELRKKYHEYMIEYHMPKEVYVKKWRQCLNIIKQGGHNLEERLNKQFDNWYKHKCLYLAEYRRLTVMNQIVWKALSNQVEYSCKIIMTGDTTIFKRINELKVIKLKEEEAAEKEKRRKEQQKKKKRRRSILFCCAQDKQKNKTQENSFENVGEHQINEYGDILPSLNVCVNNLAINYHDTVNDGEYLDHDSSDALYTEEDYWFDLEKRTHIDTINQREEQKRQSQQDQRLNENKIQDQIQDATNTKQENIAEPSKKDEKESEVDKIIFQPDTRFYDILDVDINADVNEIDKCYFKLAKKYYPNNESTFDDRIKFKEINEAYQVLGDIDKKRIYNKYGYNGLKNVTFMHPSLFYFFSCLKKYEYYTGTPHIINILKFLFEKKLSMDDIETKSEQILRFMNEYQKEIEAMLSLRLTDKIKQNIDGIDNWNTLIIDELKELLESHFTLPILDSMAYIFRNVSQCYLKNQEKAKKKIERRFKKNKLISTCAYNHLRTTLKTYFKTRKQVSSVTYKLEDNQIQNYKYKGYRNITDLEDDTKYKIIYSMVKNILNIALSDMEYTFRNVCKNILNEEEIDDTTITNRAEALNKLGNIIRQKILKGQNIKKNKKHHIQNITNNILNDIRTMNELLK